MYADEHVHKLTIAVQGQKCRTASFEFFWVWILYRYVLPMSFMMPFMMLFIMPFMMLFMSNVCFVVGLVLVCVRGGVGVGGGQTEL